MYPILFQIGPLTIYSLGVLWALAAVCAGYVVSLELKRYRLDPELASSMVIVAAVGGLVGARLLLILEEWNAFLRSPWDFVLSGSGFSWYGVNRRHPGHDLVGSTAQNTLAESC